MGLCISIIQRVETLREESVILDVSVSKARASLYGSLVMPGGDGVGACPLVLIHTGSGPTDRDGNSCVLSLNTDCLKLTAVALAFHGIASLRFDKRGIGASHQAMLSEQDLRIDHYVDDCCGWIEQCAKDKRFSSIWILGHSEGSLIGMLAASRAPSLLAGVVSVAGAGFPASQVLRRQLARIREPLLRQTIENGLNALEDGRGFSPVPRSLEALFRTSVQPYLMSWFAHDPAKVLSALPLKALIVQGTSDLQVSIADARRLHAFVPSARLALIEGMNHVLKSVGPDGGDQNRTYTDPSLPLPLAYVEVLASFIKSPI